MLTFTRFYLLLLCLLCCGLYSSLQAQSCNCTDYIYLNDPQDDVGGFVHKFRINADGTLTELPNGTTGTLPWFAAGAGLPSPHGLGQDLNGNLYIGETNSGDIRKINCEGTITPEASYQVVDGGFNINSFNGVMYVNSRNSHEIRAYDLCTGAPAGYINLSSTVGDDWGFYIDDNGTFYVTNSAFGGFIEELYVFTPTPADFTAHTTFSPIANQSTYPAGITTLFATWGVTADESGNFYVVIEYQAGSDYRTSILKYNSTGTLIGQYDENWTFDNLGIEKARGLTYINGKLYVAAGAYGDCVAIIDPVTMTLLPGGVPNMPGQNPKGIAHARECCPASASVIVDSTMCGATVNNRVFLQDLIGGCDGPVCSGTWSAAGTNTGLTFRDCDNSFSLDMPTACGQFTMSGGGGNSECSPFNLQLNIRAGSVTAAVIAGDQTICNNTAPSALTVPTPATGDGTLQYQWQQSTTSCTAGFTDIAGATSGTGFAPSAVSQTTYYRLLVDNGPGCTTQNCKDTSNCVTVTTQVCGNPNLRLRKTVNAATSSVGSQVTYTITVANDGAGDATGVIVCDTLPAGMTYVSSAPAGYNASTGQWPIGTVAAGDSVTLTLTVTLTQQGNYYNTANICGMNETDIDPNNNIDRVCVSVPLEICPGNTINAALPTGLSNIQWFKDIGAGPVAISGATTNTLAITEIGEYSFTADDSGCPAEGCCPIIVVAGACTTPCPAVICLPVTLVKH